MRRRRLSSVGVLLLAAAAALVRRAPADEPVFSVLADFEDDATAAQIVSVSGARVIDCRLFTAQVPARRQRSLAVEIGATNPGVTVACEVRQRVPVRFEQADRAALYCWVERGTGDYTLAFHVRDATGRRFTTPTQPIKARGQWERLTSALGADQLRPLPGAANSAPGALVFPLQVDGFELHTTRVGRQTAYFDDLEVESRVPAAGLIDGSFAFDVPTRIYPPGSDVRAQVMIENRSRKVQLALTVELAWLRPDGSVLTSGQGTLALPPAGADFRSVRAYNGTVRIDESGLYRLVARVRAPGWLSSRDFETSIAVTPSNRDVSRGRSVFFGVRSDLLREPPADQLLEMDVAHDLGVHLLALDVPWRTIEPQAGSLVLGALDTAVEAAVRRSFTLMLVLTDPPDWLPAAPAARVAAIQSILERLARQYPERVRYFHMLPAVAGADTAPAAIAAWATALRAVRPTIALVPPEIELPRRGAAGPLAAEPNLPIAVATVGDPAEAWVAFDACFGSHGRPPVPTWWFHTAAPETGAGHAYDAAVVLRHYIEAAQRGVKCAVWFDLRDDDNDPRDPNSARGLLRRDFSPKPALLGYATAAGLLSDLDQIGPVEGAPAEFETAMFIGGTEQVAVLIPRPGAVRPALAAPVLRTPGRIAAFDAARRPWPVLDTPGGVLVPTTDGPLFVRLELSEAAPHPQLALTQPWIAAPAVVYAGAEAQATVHVELPTGATGGALQVVLPSGSPVSCADAPQPLAAGAPAQATIRLKPKLDADFRPAALTLRVNTGAQHVDVPLEVRPLRTVRRLTAGTALTDERYRVGELAAVRPALVSASGKVYAAWEPSGLQVALVISDDVYVPLRAVGTEITGDELDVGAAAPQQDAPVALRIAMLVPGVDVAGRAQALAGTLNDQADRVVVELTRSEDGRRQTVRLRYPAATFGAGELAARRELLLAARYADDDADGLARLVLAWGVGLEGERSAEDYERVVLIDGN